MLFRQQYGCYVKIVYILLLFMLQSLLIIEMYVIVI